MNNQPLVQPNPEQVVTCVSLILSNNMLAESHAYLQQCERHPEFVKILFNIFERLEVGPLRQIVYLTCVNVIKRNMHHNRKTTAVVNLDRMKPFIKETLVRYCRDRPVGLKWSYLKDLVRYISHIEYPHAWPELQQLMVQNLEKLYNANGVLSQRLIEDVDLVRVVMKGQGRKSSFLKKDKVFEVFTVHIARPLELISTAMDSRLNNKSPVISAQELRLCSITDRTLLSCLATITSALQTDPELAQVVGRLLTRLSYYLSLLEHSSDSSYIDLVLKCMKRLLLYTGILQSTFPLMFAPILTQYLNMLVNLIRLTPQFLRLDKQQLVAKATMMSLIRVLRTYAYYADQQTFRSSVMRKTTPQEQLPVRQNCHRVFREFFTAGILEQVLSLIVTNIMGFRGEETEDELEEQDTSSINQMENSPANIGSNLLSILMDKFKVPCGMIVGGILNNLINSGFSVSTHLQSNSYYMLALLPNIYEEQQLPMDRIFVVLDHLHSTKQFNKHFALMVAKYYMVFTNEQLQRIFDSLIDITVTHNDKITVFESCKTLALILTKKEGSVNLANLPKTILTIIQMFPKFQNPTALRHLLKVINNILSNVEFDSDVVRQCVESNTVHEVLRKPNEALLYLLCEFLQGLLTKTSSPQITRLALLFLDGNLDKELDNPEVVHQLWVVTVRNYQPGGQLEDALLHLFNKFIGNVEEQDLKCYCQLLTEYMLLGLLSLSWEQLTVNVLHVLQSDGLSELARIQCWSLYLYTSILNPAIVVPLEILRRLFQTLEAIDGHPNAQNIEVQSNLINIIDLFICRNPAGFSALVCQALSSAESVWIEIWLKHSRLLYTYESEKLLTVAILQMIDHFERKHVEARFEWLIRLTLMHLNPSETPQPVIRKNNPSRRRIIFRKHIPVMELDLNPLFREKFSTFSVRLGLTEEFVRNNLKSQEILQRIMKLLA